MSRKNFSLKLKYMIKLRDYISNYFLTAWLEVFLTASRREFNKEELIEKYGDVIVAYDDELNEIKRLLKRIIEIGREAMRGIDYVYYQVSPEQGRYIVNDIDFTDWVVERDPITNLEEWKRCPCYDERTGRIYYSVRLFEVDEEDYYITITTISGLLELWDAIMKNDEEIIDRNTIRPLISVVREGMVRDYETIKEVERLSERIEDIITIIEYRVSKIVLGKPKDSLTLADWAEALFKAGDLDDPLESKFIESIKRRMEKEAKNNDEEEKR